MENYAHVVVINADEKLIKIYRLLDDGRKEFFTQCSIDGISADQGEKFSSLAQQLGENILMDSPAAREVMQI